MGPLGCTAANFAGFPAGSVALIDRGTCNVSLKAQLAQSAGAVAVVLRNNVAGAPPDFSFGGGDPRSPSRSWWSGVRLAPRSSTRSPRVPCSVRIDPNAAQSLRGTIAGTSSRGPVQSFNTIKPDIGAPGAWLSAEAGTGAGETNFGGTSGAAPTVTGVAALVLDRFPKLAPVQVKARLLNAADTRNQSLTELGERYPTPITRIGAGEVRAEAAVFATYVFEADDKAGWQPLHRAAPPGLQADLREEGDHPQHRLGGPHLHVGAVVPRSGRRRARCADHPDAEPGRGRPSLDQAGRHQVHRRPCPAERHGRSRAWPGPPARTPSSSTAPSSTGGSPRPATPAS